MRAFTRDELMDLWRSSMDPGYTQPLLAGGATGIETIGQLAQQLARASEMVNRDGQAMFVMPSSAQSDEPAGGARLATVQLSITRTGNSIQEVTFYEGQVLVEVVTTDFGPDGPVDVRPGRRYVIPQTCGFVPGALAVQVTANAEKPGYGYNLPLPGTIQAFVQPASTLANNGAQVVPGQGSHRLVLRPVADVLGVPNIGQYIELAGANAGAIRRVIDFNPPVDSSTGGTAVLAATGVLAVNAFAGSFIPGESIDQTATGASGVVLQTSAGYVVFDRTSLADFAVGVIAGAQSGVVAFVNAIEQDPNLLADTAASWRVLGWETDLQIEVTNATSPTGGRSAMLDELGVDRGVNRSPGETDDSYRKRIWKLPDVVSPNAIKRAVNRVLSQFGSAGCFREVGDIDRLFPGFFYDVAPGDVGFDSKYAYAYDLDFAVRPQDRFKLVMDYTEFRAFFMIGVPPASLGEFGFFYDVAGAINFYDSSPFLDFYDGYPLTSAVVNRRVWDAVEKARAGGVGFTLYEERFGCM